MCLLQAEWRATVAAGQARVCRRRWRPVLLSKVVRSLVRRRDRAPVHCHLPGLLLSERCSAVRQGQAHQQEVARVLLARSALPAVAGLQHVTCVLRRLNVALTDAWC